MTGLIQNPALCPKSRTLLY